MTLIGTTLLASLLATQAPLSLNLIDDDAEVPCHMPPQGATQSCIDCMDDACKQYQADYEACQSNPLCRLLAEADYELTLLLCSTCYPVAKGLAPLVLVLPPSQRAWVAERAGNFK